MVFWNMVSIIVYDWFCRIEGKRARGQEGKRARGQEGKRARI